MTHSLQSDLWWTIPFGILLGHFGIPIGSLTIKPALARHTGVRRVFGSRQPHRCTWVVLWLFCFRSTPQRSLILGPLSRVLFGESLVNRLDSEIDQTYLSIEAQCVSHHYPRWTATLGDNSFDIVCVSTVCKSVRLSVSLYQTNEQTYRLDFWHGGQVKGNLGQVGRSRS